MPLPSSATPTCFLHRLQQLRSAAGLLRDGGAQSLLIVAGSDASYSSGSIAALHYLLGRSGSDVMSASSQATAAVSTPDLDSESLDEVMMCIGARSLGLHCQPQDKAPLEKLTRLVEGVQIYCRATAQFGNAVSGRGEQRRAVWGRPAIRRRIAAHCCFSACASAPCVCTQDEDELFKIHSFIALTQTCSHVVVPVISAASSSSDSQAARDDRMKRDMETWPIVQAYGLDGRTQQIRGQRSNEQMREMRTAV